MSFDWAEYHQLARTLADRGAIMRASDAARERSAINRAYYAVFCSARNYLRTKHSKVYSGDIAHKEVHDALLALSPEARKIARLLHNVRIERNHADYDDIYNSTANISNVIDWVEQALALLKTLR